MKNNKERVSFLSFYLYDIFVLYNIDNIQKATLFFSFIFLLYTD